MENLGLILDLIRSGEAAGRPEIQRVSGLGRGLISERVNQLLRANLVKEGSFLNSTGGRAARGLQLNASNGLLLVCYSTLADFHVGVADLSGQLLASSHEFSQFDAGPERMFATAEKLWKAMLDDLGRTFEDVWSVGIGIPAHINFATGTFIDSPSLPASWKGYQLRRTFTQKFKCPVWLEMNDNLLALGESRTGSAKGKANFLYLNADMAVGCGIVSEGHVTRGAHGAAGNIGHITIGGDALCRCGRRGCLEAVAGGEALLRDAAQAGATGQSPYFAAKQAKGSSIEIADLAEGVRTGDPTSQKLVAESGANIGRALAATINVLNPSMVVAGGCLPKLGDLFLASMREAIYRHSLPFVTRDLEIMLVEQTERTGLLGAAQMLTDQLFSQAMLEKWFPKGRPGPDLHDLTVATAA